MDADLIRRALAVNQANLALGHEVFAADGATFVRNRNFPPIRDANHVAHITASAPDEIDRLLARADREFAGFPHRRFDCDFTTPPAFEARLALEGYERSEALVMLLEGDLIGAPKPADVRRIDSAGDWSAYTVLRMQDWREYTERIGQAEQPGVGRMMIETSRAKSPPVRYWLACAGGEPRGYFNAWEGVDGVGQVEDLFVQKEYRHRGLATALIHRCVADARAHGAGPIVIVADPTDTPKRMYAAVGFRPVAIKREWRRTIEDAR